MMKRTTALRLLIVLTSGIFSAMTTECLAATPSEIVQAKQNIISLIDSGKLADADTAVDKLKTDFAGHPDLPETLYWIGERCEWSGKFENAKRTYKQAMQNHSGNSWANRAELGISRAEVLSLILSQKFDLSEKAIDKMTTNFSRHPDLPETLYWISERYSWLNRFDEEKRLYQQIIQKYPDSPYADKSRLGVLKAESISLIMKEDFAGAQTTIDKMTSDFGKNPNLAETLYWITERYRWFSRFEEEKGLYQQIIQKYPGSPYASKAKLGIARADAMSLIMAKDYDGAQKTIDKLASDFSGHPDLAESLYWTAERYEWFNKFQDAKSVYQQIMEKHPDSPYAGRARVAASMAEVRDIIISRDYSRSEEALNKATAEFSGHSDWPRLITLAGEQYFKEGLSMDKEGLSDKAMGFFEEAVKIWDGFISKNPDSDLMPEICYWAGDCYHKMGKYGESIRRFQQVVDIFPQYKYSWHAQFMIGSAYQRMKDVGTISESEADSKTNASYQQLISKWPDCDDAGYAQTWLNEHKSN